MNVQGLAPQTVQSKVPFITDLIVPDKQLFIGLSETWLKDHKDPELIIEGYTPFRCDSSRVKKSNRGRHTGGVALYVRDDIAITSEVIVSHSSEAVQLLCLYSKEENPVISCLYRQPDDSAHGHPSTPNDLKAALCKLKIAVEGLSPIPDIVFGGDFNLPHIDWSSCTASRGATQDERIMLNLINELCNDLLLCQVVDKPTHKDGNILDLVFVNNQQMVHDKAIIPVAQSTSHHSIVQISTTYKADMTSNKQQRPKPTMFNALNFFHPDADWDKILEELSGIDWSPHLAEKSPDQMLDYIYTTCYNICAKYVPERSLEESRKTSRVHRFRRSLTNRRRRIIKRLLKITSPSLKNQLSAEVVEIEKKLQKSYRESELHMESRAVESIKSNPKYFYSYTKSRSKCTSKIGPLLNDNNELTSNNEEMAELLSSQYSSVFSTPKLVPEENTNIDGGNKLTDINFSAADIEDAIKELRTNAAPGPDGFPAILLIQCRNLLASPLALFWKKCLEDGFIPPRLKKSLITPIHKGDSRAHRANYRPIALTSHLIKIFEKVLRKHIVEHMNKNDLFNKNQHGFRSGRSCLSQLLDHLDQIMDILEKGGNVDVIYLDFSKAFDKLDFNIVLKKIKAMGIDGKVYNWIRSFLTDRVQQVSVNGFLSKPAHVISGVPQGSVLGPLLFLVLIADIDEEAVYAIIKSFADDTRAARGIFTEEDIKILQKELEKIYQWSDDNNMELNDKKFEGTSYGLNEDLKAKSTYTTPSGKPVTMKKTVKDLGVLMSNDCKFKEHIDQVIEKAKNMASWILRTFRTRECRPMVLLFKMLVLPILEYCSVLWSPQDVGSIQKLESIQWSFIRKITSNTESNYWKRLAAMNLYSLQRRRERYRIIYIWKVLEGLVPNVNMKINLSTNFHARLGRKCQIPNVPNTKLAKSREASLSINGARLFNIMPKSVRNLTNVNLSTFKCALDRFLNCVPDEPQLPGYTAHRRASSNSLLAMISENRKSFGSFALDLENDEQVAGMATLPIDQ